MPATSLPADAAAHDDTSDPRFSIIIPAYNRERYIGAAIGSAFSQRDPAEEIIVVDDGSTDGTSQVVHEFTGGPVIRYFHQRNQGPAAARNYGAAAAKGNWLAFLDADDIWHPDKLLIQAEYIRKHPQVYMFWCDVDYMDEGGNPREPFEWNDRLAPLMFNRPMCPIPSTVVLRKDIFSLLGGFNQQMRCYEDGEFFMRVAARFPIHFIDRTLVTYRCHRNQLHRSVLHRAMSWPYMYDLLDQLWRDDPQKKAILNAVSAANHTHVGKHYLRKGDLEEARRHFRMGFKQKPLLWRNLRRWAVSYVPGVRTIYGRIKKHAVGV
jgi:glycosyltransferase involved in cell wall biosynthesis